jgi:hypothetical protein
MTAPRLYRIVFISGIFALLAAYGGLWIRFINDPVERTGSDFIGFYSIGRITQDFGPSRVYDPALQQRVEEEVVGFELIPGQVLINQHLPFLIPVLQAIISRDYVASFYRWNLLMLMLYITSVVLLSHHLKAKGLESSSVIAMSFGALLFYPFFFSQLNGQDTVICLLGIAIWFVGLRSDREALAGLGLSLTTVRPHIAILMAIPMFFHHRKTFWGFTIGAGFLAAVSLGLLGVAGTREFIHVLQISTQGQWYGLHEEYMFNLIGLILRILPFLTPDTVHILGWAAYGLAILASCFLWNKDMMWKSGRMGLLVILGVFLAPHLHFHDLTLLLIPVYEIVLNHMETGESRHSVLIGLPVIFSYLLLISNTSPILQYSVPYLIMAVSVWYLFDPKPRTPLAILRRSQSPEK